MSRLSLALGGTLTAGFAATALLSRLWTPQDPTAMNLLARLKAPLEHGLLGTDQIGRDVASILMAGAWTSLGTACLATLAGGLVGTALGTLAEGRIARAVMAANAILFAFPPVLSAILLGAVLGPGGPTAILAIALFMIPVFARITRAEALRVWTQDYILAARMAGKSRARITLDHVLPNISGQIIAELSIQTGLAILAEAGLSFLGMGSPPPTPSWGRMLSDAQTYLTQAPHLVLAPGLAIALAVLGLNLLGDGIRHRLDAKGRA
ncbi:ABC transporter permease [Thioclava sp. FTW29]|uniref:ABC transporter permease n=1 Tax=Thioclava litoralis TaxID=3076557 RepID=A0ABZ1E676_9RHOB|nr:ABC transporter permease [Thioclava sp. FTW29]